MSTTQALVDHELSSQAKPAIPYADRAHGQGVSRQFTQCRIEVTLEALNLRDLEERIYTVANANSRSKLKAVVYDWKTIARLLGDRQPLERFDLTARFPIGLPTCQLLDPALRAANSKFDELAWLGLTPSQFAKPLRWTEEQEKNDNLLCFRPVKPIFLFLWSTQYSSVHIWPASPPNEPLPHDDSDAMPEQPSSPPTCFW